MTNVGTSDQGPRDILLAKPPQLAKWLPKTEDQGRSEAGLKVHACSEGLQSVPNQVGLTGMLHQIESSVNGYSWRQPRTSARTYGISAPF